jgi:hypothetical protein
MWRVPQEDYMTFREIEKRLKMNLTYQDALLLFLHILFGMWRDWRDINGARD